MRTGSPVIDVYAIPGPMPLTPREKEVLVALARGSTQKQIAYRMGVHIRTVNLYAARARDKLCASTREEAVVKAVQLKIILLDRAFFKVTKKLQRRSDCYYQTDFFDMIDGVENN
jgi:DNA-binding CsgD family transcriptional regulator